MNQSTETAQENFTQSNPHSNEDWLAERKREIQEVLENKSRELSKRAQTHFSERMGHYESALKDASGSLQSDEEKQAADITEGLANKIREAADYFQDSEPERLAADAAETVKRSPWLTLGAAVACGFLAGRVVASAGEDTHASS